MSVAQDVNPAQYEIVRMLHFGQPIPSTSLIPPLPRTVFVVGDPNQAIYSWRGADVTIIQKKFELDFNRGSGVTTAFLNMNYRCCHRHSSSRRKDI